MWSSYNMPAQTMAVYTLKCIGYDAPFQRNLAEKFPTWVPTPKKPKAEKGQKATKNIKADKKGNPTGKAPTRAPKKSGEKRKRVDLESDGEDSDEELEYYDEEEEEEELEPVYTSRGTRSRPIQVE